MKTYTETLNDQEPRIRVTDKNGEVQFQMTLSAAEYALRELKAKTVATEATVRLILKLEAEIERINHANH